MSPEQAGGNAVDKRTDIWSLGVVLYEIATGELPFQGDYEPAIVYSILNEEPRTPTKVRPELPADLDSILAKALAKEPPDRYQQIEEFSTTFACSRRASLPKGKTAHPEPAALPLRTGHSRVAGRNGPQARFRKCSPASSLRD